MPGQIELYTHVPVLPTLVRYLTRTGALNVSLCAAYLLEASFVADRAKFFAGTLSAMSAMLLLEVPHVNILSKMDLVRDTMGRRQLKRFLDPDASLLDEEDEEQQQQQQEEAEEQVDGEDEQAKDDKDNDDEPNGHDHRRSRPRRRRLPPSGDGGGGGSVVGPPPPKEGSADDRMRGTAFKRLNRAVAQLIDDFSMVSFLKLDAQDDDSVGAVLSYIDDAIQYHEAQEPREPADEVEIGEWNA
jgi:hypothetical protein